MSTFDDKINKQDSLNFHQFPKPGKIGIHLKKNIDCWKDLSLAYTPGVAYPCTEIFNDPLAVYDYTNRANSVAVISNGSAVLGLGNLGSLASKPVMEGKAALFRKFSGIDSIDIQVDSQDPQEIIKCISLIGASFGGINLEDIKSPECFIIENELIQKLDIPVFHDDQHGTAIVVLAGILNALEIQKKRLQDIKILCVGGGAAAIACLNLLIQVGVPSKNIILSDQSGIVYLGRPDTNPWKLHFAVDTSSRTILEGARDTDLILGLSVAGAILPQVIAAMAPHPIIFAMANPTPEILPEQILKIRSDAIIATGRSDYPNQINNLLAFPYVFRGALDVRASQINTQMKIAAAKAIAAIVKLPISQEIKLMSGTKAIFGPQYCIPSTFDPRLFVEVSYAVAQAAIQTQVSRVKNFSLQNYRTRLKKGVSTFYIEN